eukprot:CAMPEP_0115121020 /NCGR_PEP_ID=MMETSP0227-20121206/46019_1 /TAXON_ID=89957 /ORGANISM="Polarella glacialis, Strain CCMP 1383" /LENGTH=355 /DNA_ID=CAMNT_0002522763 /DNA_START=32 /DNA_END=1099 /DNA_ORIENTATION=-
MATTLEGLAAGDRVRVQGGKNFEKFHGGMEGTIVENNVESKNMKVQFDDVATSGPDPTSVAYRHLEFAPTGGGYRAPPAPKAQAQEPQGPLLKEHGAFRSKQLVQLGGLQSAPELNGRLARLQKFDVTAERWEVDVRGDGGSKRLKEANLLPPPKPEVPPGLTVAELKERGNECFKRSELEQAVAFYSAALDLLDVDGERKEDSSEAALRAPEADDPKYVAVLLGNRAQCFIVLCREVNGEDAEIGQEARRFAMRANMDAAQAIELDPTNGKAYYRRGCAVLGMAPSASRAKEAIHCLEVAMTGRASGGEGGVVLPNAMRHEVTNLLDYAKRRLDACVETAVPDMEQCRENCSQQ